MNHFCQLLAALTLMLLAGCVSPYPDSEFHVSNGSHDNGNVSVEWDLSRGEKDGLINLVKVQVMPDAPYAEVEVLVYLNGRVIEEHHLQPVSAESALEIRGVRVLDVSALRLRVIAVPDDGSEEEVVVDSGISIKSTSSTESTSSTSPR